MNTEYSIKVYKQYFNFSSAHFLMYEDGAKERLHGHNYKVQVKATANGLEDDMVMDFLQIKPLVREICDSLDHLVLMPGENKYITYSENKSNLEIVLSDGKFYSFPKEDVLVLPIENISAERLAIYIANELQKVVATKLDFKFKTLEVEVEETPGQSAQYYITEDRK